MPSLQPLIQSRILSLRSQRAIAVNIEIMRTFVRVGALAATHAELAEHLAELEKKTEALAEQHDLLSLRNTCTTQAGLRCLARADDAT